MNYGDGEVQIVQGEKPKLREGQFIFNKCSYAVMVACKIIGTEWQKKQQEQNKDITQHVG